ncbi:MAG: hypothetical protein GWM90_01480 [Gemmatimonadetes bacterium]|nr:hypothetical protein [Gemmatimonadota bacterium]NIQ52260.1 hypothetical protein [Gemmatimonadota bacterium]NIU72362.1 hypothetical protein [Gammaproteobacteria bacterium]NIX42844.1 hypothetical protein [Gemmatimonadota bacterium]NIY07021.1 hypothetical protein [Gemmatimonadota bacterium]
MSRDDDARLRLARARKRLLAELTGIADAAHVSARSRCPYRDRHDRCTFRGGCRNQRERGATQGCGGGTLDPRPAPSGPG